MIDVGKFSTFIVAVVLVVIGLYLAMRIYSYVTGYQAPEETGLEIIDDKLRKMTDWRTYYLTNFKMVKKDQGVFHLMMEFNFNNRSTFEIIPIF